MRQDRKTIFTIGYAGFPNPNDLLHALADNDIRLLIDVRSTPFSQHYRQYDMPLIREMLKSVDIKYRNYAKQFGARQDNRSYYRNGRLDFDVFSKTDQFIEGITNLRLALNYGYTPVLMCAEKEPSICHRAIMVTKELHEMGFAICHLMPEGKWKTQEDIEAELLDTYFEGRKQGSFLEPFKSDDELILEAYIKRNDEIGYREGDL